MPSVNNGSEIVVEVPEGIAAGRYWVSNAQGSSNEMSYFLEQNIAYSVAVAGASPIYSIGGIVPSHATEVSGNTVQFKKLGNSAEVLYSFALNGNGQPEMYLSAILEAGVQEVEFSYRSTALANMASHLIFFIESKGMSLDEAADILAQSPEFANYLQEVTEALEADKGFFSFANARPGSAELLNKYSEHFKNYIDNAKSQSSLSADQFNAANYSRAHVLRGATLNAATTEAVDTDIEPSIVSYPETNGTWNLFDMSMEASTFLDNSVELGNKCGEGVDPKWYEVLGYDGCVRLENRSQLYLSYRVYEVDPATGEIPADAISSPLAEHIDTPYHTAMASPTSGTFLVFEFWSSDKLIDTCVYKDCAYQILTPGVDGSFGPTPFNLTGTESHNQIAQKARRMLTIRTIIDNIIIRFYSILFDAAGLGLDKGALKKPEQARAVIKAVYEYMPALTSEVEKLASKEKVTEQEWIDLSQAIGLEIYNKEIKPIMTDLSNFPNIKLGPTTTALLKVFAYDQADFIQALGQKLAKKLIPGFGAVETAYEASQLATAMVDMGKTIKDLATVPSKLDYVVSWGLQLADITPRSIQQNGQAKTFTLVGSGMAVQKGVFSDEDPEVLVIDTATNERLDVTFLSVNKQGTELEFMLANVSQIDAAKGPLDVYVEHRDDKAKLPYQILVGTDLMISAITPNRAKAGEQVTISGIGFSEQLVGNIVRFVSESGEVKRASVTAATTESLTVTVPDSPGAGYVTVEVGGEVSNQLPFFGPGQVSITFGDNGNFNDDVYKLAVNGRVIYENGTPKRKVGPLAIALDEGEHTVELTGIRADDGIGTYYIEFSGDVVNVSGDAQSGRDLCPEVVKTFTITVGPTVANSVPSQRSYVIDPMSILQDESSSAPSECAGQ